MADRLPKTTLVIRRMVSYYRNGIQKNKWTYIYPTATSGSLFTLSDIIAQLFCEKQDHVNWMRTMRFAAFGYLIAGPMNAFRFRLVDHLIKDKRLSGAIKKMAIDQSIIPPIYNVSFFAFMGVAKQTSWTDLKQTYATTFVDVTINAYKVFPATLTFAILTMPPHHRVTFMSIVSLMWNTYLSHVSSSQDTENDGISE